MTFKEKRADDGFSIGRVNILTWWWPSRTCSEFVMSNTVVFLARPRVLFFSTEMERVMGGGFERDFARNKMGMSRSFGEPLGRGMGKKASGGQGHPPGAQAHAQVRGSF